jgi:hypothetical protein
MDKPGRRHDDLFGRIVNFTALRIAARKAVKGKRKKPGAAAALMRRRWNRRK